MNLLSMAVLSFCLLSMRMLDAAELNVTLRPLVDAVEALRESMRPDAVLSQPAAQALSVALKEDLQTTGGAQLVVLLGSRYFDTTSWQIAASTLHQSLGQDGAEAEDIPLLEAAFIATIKPGDHWLDYSPPRGWCIPPQLREELVMHIVYARTGRAEEGFPEKNLLADNPVAWLKRLRVMFPSATDSAHPIITLPPASASSTDSDLAVPNFQADHTASLPTLPSKSSNALAPPGAPPAASTSLVMTVMGIAATGLIWMFVKRRAV